MNQLVAFYLLHSLIAGVEDVDLTHLVIGVWHPIWLDKVN